MEGAAGVGDDERAGPAVGVGPDVRQRAVLVEPRVGRDQVGAPGGVVDADPARRRDARRGAVRRRRVGVREVRGRAVGAGRQARAADAGDRGARRRARRALTPVPATPPSEPGPVHAARAARRRAAQSASCCAPPKRTATISAGSSTTATATATSDLQRCRGRRLGGGGARGAAARARGPAAPAARAAALAAIAAAGAAIASGALTVAVGVLPGGGAEQPQRLPGVAGGVGEGGVAGGLVVLGVVRADPVLERAEDAADLAAAAGALQVDGAVLAGRGLQAR